MNRLDWPSILPLSVEIVSYDLTPRVDSKALVKVTETIEKPSNE